jgi:O-antigen/teichoic acid export membrane protein
MRLFSLSEIVTRVKGSRVASAGVWGLASRATGIVVRFVTVPISLDLLSKEQYGLFLTLSSMTMWLSISDFGLPGALQNHLIQLRAAGRADAFRKAAFHACFLLVKLSSIAALIAAIVFLTVPINDLLNVPEKLREEFRNCLMVSVVLFVILFPGRIGPSMAYAYGRLDLPPKAEIIGIVLGLVALIILWQLRIDHIGALMAVSFIGACASLLSLTIWMLNRSLREAPTQEPFIKWGSISNASERVSYKKSAFFTLDLIGGLLIFFSLPLVISASGSPELVPAYAVPSIFFSNFIMLQAVVLKPNAARVKELHALARYAELKARKKLALKISILAAALYGMGIVIIGDWFLNLWTSGRVHMSLEMAIGFAVFTLIAAMDNVCSSFLIAQEQIRFRSMLTVVYGLVQVVLTAILVPLVGIEWLPLSFSFTLATCALLPSLRRLRSLEVRGSNL